MPSPLKPQGFDVMTKERGILFWPTSPTLSTTPLLKTKQRSLKTVLESKSFRRAARTMGTERTAFRAGSPESKASAWSLRHPGRMLVLL